MKTSVGGTWALRQMRELVRMGVEVHVVLPNQGPLWADYRRSGIQPHRLQTDFPVSAPWLLPRRVFALKRMVEVLKPDIVHSHFVGTTLTMRLALRSKTTLPRIFQVPGPLHLEHAVYRCVEIATAQTNDYWIATCSATRRRFVDSGVDPRRVFLSFYGMDPDKFLISKTQGKLRGELGFSGDTPVVGMVAFMYKPKWMTGQKRGIKGHEDLIDAVALASRKLPDLKVVFIGGPWNGASAYEAELKQYAFRKIPGRAFFLGTRADVPEIYSDFDVAVHPSHSENLGGAAESLLMGVPTIATNVGGLPDVVVPGKTGYLVPPRRPDVLAAAILHVLQHPEEGRRLAANGRAWVAANCDVRKTARNVFDLYREILACNQGGSRPSARRSLSGPVPDLSILMENSVRSTRRSIPKPPLRRPANSTLSHPADRLKQKSLKRALDIVIASIALISALPVMAVIGGLILLTMGRPILFGQTRPGRFGKTFRIYKFRTMADARGPDGCLLPDGRRLSRLGRWLRASSLDELPELINVIKGDMSLVGPRPLLVQYLNRYTPEQMRRHEMKPGLTGWAQVNGRNAIEWEKKFELDVWYVDHWTWRLDMKILLLTIREVLRREGISHPGEATMTEFQPDRSGTSPTPEHRMRHAS